VVACARRSGKKEYEPQSAEDHQYCDYSQAHMVGDLIFTRIRRKKKISAPLE
jgi:hypothetical protein